MAGVTIFLPNRVSKRNNETASVQDIDELRNLQNEQTQQFSQIVEALSSHPDTRNKLTTSGIAAIESGKPFVSIQELKGTPPPADRALANELLGYIFIPNMNASEAEAALAAQGLSGYEIEEEIQVGIAGITTEQINGNNSLLENTVQISVSEAITAIEVIPWGVERIQAPAVWKKGNEGSEIQVAVLDTGIVPHDDLPTILLSDMKSTIPNSDTYDGHSHGTHVAGTIVGRKGNGIGVIGVSPKVKLLVCKVLANDGKSRGTSVGDGITWAIEKRADVINLSLAGPRVKSTQEALELAYMRGIVIVAAAGNDQGAPVSWPAASDECIAVASIDENNNRSDFSNIGPELDVAAPGGNIYSTLPNNSYGYKSGTSMAAPHVTGAVALLLSESRMSPQQVKTILQQTAKNLGDQSEYGAGLIQIDQALTTGLASVVTASKSATDIFI